MLSLRGENKSSGQKPLATPTKEAAKITPEYLLPLNVISLRPKHASKNVELEQKIFVTFNKSPKEGEYQVSLIKDYTETVVFRQLLNGKILTISPYGAWKEGGIYTLRVTIPALKDYYETTFLTQVLQTKPDTRPIPLITKIAEINRVQYPKIYLSNKLPYEEEAFTMIWEVSPQKELVFGVTSRALSGEALKERVRRWLFEIGLTQEQIDGLTIYYR
jgi:hypothetical protein